MLPEFSIEVLNHFIKVCNDIPEFSIDVCLINLYKYQLVSSGSFPSNMVKVPLHKPVKREAESIAPISVNSKIVQFFKCGDFKYHHKCNTRNKGELC